MEWHELMHEMLAQEPDSPVAPAQLREDMESYLIDHPEENPDYTAARRHFNRVVGLREKMSKLHALVEECQEGLSPAECGPEKGSGLAGEGARGCMWGGTGFLGRAKRRIGELSLYSGHLDRLADYLSGEADILSYRVRCAEGLTLDTFAQACDAAPLLAGLWSGLAEAEELLIEEEGRYRSAMEREVCALLRRAAEGAITPGGP